MSPPSDSARRVPQSAPRRSAGPPSWGPVESAFGTISWVKKLFDRGFLLPPAAQLYCGAGDALGCSGRATYGPSSRSSCCHSPVFKKTTTSCCVCIAEPLHKQVAACHGSKSWCGCGPLLVASLRRAVPSLRFTWSYSSRVPSFLLSVRSLKPPPNHPALGHYERK